MFALNGNDMIFGGPDSQLYGSKNDDIILIGVEYNLGDGGPGHDTLLGGAGNDLLSGERETTNSLRELGIVSWMEAQGPIILTVLFRYLGLQGLSF